MTTTRAELIENFSNGKLPSGENFADLINSMVHQDQFDAHVQTFEDWKARGEVALGSGDRAWRIAVNDNAQVQLLRGDGSDGLTAPQGFADIQLGGWTSLTGRIGDCSDPKAFMGYKIELDVAGMPNVPSDGSWHPIVNMPGHPCVFEVTAGTARVAYLAPLGIMSMARGLIGISEEQNAITHGTIVATGANRQPSLTVSAQPDAATTWNVLGAYLAAVLILVLGAALLAGTPAENEIEVGLGSFGDWLVTYVGKLLAGLGITGIDPTKFTHLYLPLAILVVNVLYALRLLIRANHLRRRSVCLRWKKTGGSVFSGDRQWTLQLRGPTLAPGPQDSNIYYSITKLWN
ncbi:hypothetical protein [uncultured Roseovarius sp.]|uniref:hypothetical protein n=1 Tax=uncultured Roseovarius sp. TaxID=293344 RepID=UPI00262564C0|nr:hypothetical protein [uncultured Roseovarius sp.]